MNSDTGGLESRENAVPAPLFLPESLSDEEMQAELDRYQTGRGGNRMYWFLGSLLAFAALAVLGSGPLMMATLIGVLLFHELGHFLGMKLSGYSNPRIFFLPGFGAATTASKGTGNPIHELWVLLLGPVPGILVGLGITAFHRISDQGWQLELAKLLLLVNAFNLLPISPLDGGRIMEILLFRRHPVVELAFRCLAALALIGMAIGMEIWLLLAVAVFSLVAAPHQFKVSRAAKRISDSLPAFPSLLAACRSEVRRLFPKVGDRKLYLALLGLIRERAGIQPLPLRPGLLFGGAYLVVLILSSLTAMTLLYLADNPFVMSAQRRGAGKLSPTPLPKGVPGWSAEEQQAEDMKYARLQSIPEVGMDTGDAIVARHNPGDIRMGLIVVESRTAAELAANLIAGGTPFGEVAGNTSVGPNARSGGDIGFVDPRDLDGKISRALSELSPGQVSPIIFSDGKYFLLKRLE